jgi:hypothetical protein
MIKWIKHPNTINLLHFDMFYSSFVTKSSNLRIVSSIDTSDFPPAALMAPPLK